MFYPRECFSINETQTRMAMLEYERKYNNWYKNALELYPNYYNMDLREKLKIDEEIDKVVGYSI